MFFDRFTARARRAMALSRQAAQKHNHDFIAPEHILLGVLDTDGAAMDALQALDVSRPDLVAAVESGLARGTATATGQIPFTPRAKTVLARSMEEARDLGHEHVGTEHLLLGLVRDEGIAGAALGHAGLEVARVSAAIRALLGRGPRALVLASNRKEAAEDVIRPVLADAGAGRIDLADPEACDADLLERHCRFADLAVLVAPVRPGLVFAAGICHGVRTPAILFSDGPDELGGPFAWLPVVSTAEELRDILKREEL